MHNSSILLERSIATTNIKNAHPKVQGAVTADYVPHKEPTDNLEAAIHAPVIEPPIQHLVAIKCNTDVKIPDDVTIDLSHIPEADDVVKESEERNIVADAVVAADEQQKIADSDIPQTNSARNYFLEKITQFGNLYDDKGQNPIVGLRIQALGCYFRDPTTTSKKWSNEGDIIIYGGLNTGVKFASFLESIVTPISKRKKILPPYFELLMSQITPFINDEEVTTTTTGTTAVDKTDIFAQTIPSATLGDPDTSNTHDQERIQFVKDIAAAYKHSAANAKQCAVYAFCGAFLPASAAELTALYEHLEVLVTNQVSMQKTVDRDRKIAAIAVSRERTGAMMLLAQRKVKAAAALKERAAKRVKTEAGAAGPS